MRDKSRGASAAADVKDCENGTYVATVTLFWIGNAEIVALLVTPREIIDTYFRRRLVHFFIVC